MKQVCRRHTKLKLMALQFVKPYVKANKNDAADAEAICEAVGRPNMRFVPIKNIEQQAVLALHRVRQGFVKARTAQANQIRGLPAEFGLIIPQGIGVIQTRVPELAMNCPAHFAYLYKGCWTISRNWTVRSMKLKRRFKPGIAIIQRVASLRAFRVLDRLRPARLWLP
ncbi:IS110 family transposase [Mycoavidus sp. B2-EB]|nr:IS110 family transposase [Mycoavidus sp. B2-EB]